MKTHCADPLVPTVRGYIASVYNDLIRFKRFSEEVDTPVAVSMFPALKIYNMIFKMMTGKVALPLNELYTVHHSTTRGCKSKIHYSSAKSCVRASFFTQGAGSEFLMLTKKHTLPSSFNHKKLVGSYHKTH